VTPIGNCHGPPSSGMRETSRVSGMAAQHTLPAPHCWLLLHSNCRLLVHAPGSWHTPRRVGRQQVFPWGQPGAPSGLQVSPTSFETKASPCPPPSLAASALWSEDEPQPTRRAGTIEANNTVARVTRSARRSKGLNSVSCFERRVPCKPPAAALAAPASDGNHPHDRCHPDRDAKSIQGGARLVSRERAGGL
jgi:hypothetical protein